MASVFPAWPSILRLNSHLKNSDYLVCSYLQHLLITFLDNEKVALIMSVKIIIFITIRYTYDKMKIFKNQGVPNFRMYLPSIRKNVYFNNTYNGHLLTMNHLTFLCV